MFFHLVRRTGHFHVSYPLECGSSEGSGTVEVELLDSKEFSFRTVHSVSETESRQSRSRNVRKLFRVVSSRGTNITDRFFRSFIHSFSSYTRDLDFIPPLRKNKIPFSFFSSSVEVPSFSYIVYHFLFPAIFMIDCLKSLQGKRLGACKISIFRYPF